jgi:hypothetical protein
MDICHTIAVQATNSLSSNRPIKKKKGPFLSSIKVVVMIHCKSGSVSNVGFYHLQRAIDFEKERKLDFDCFYILKVF